MEGITIARIIDSELASRGMSKAEFYAQSGVSSATLSQWRTGKYEPTADKIAKVEKCLNISFADYEKSDPREGLREDLQTLLRSAEDLPPSSVYELIAEIHRRKEMGKVDSSD